MRDVDLVILDVYIETIQFYLPASLKLIKTKDIISYTKKWRMKTKEQQKISAIRNVYTVKNAVDCSSK